MTDKPSAAPTHRDRDENNELQDDDETTTLALQIALPVGSVLLTLLGIGCCICYKPYASNNNLSEPLNE